MHPRNKCIYRALLNLFSPQILLFSVLIYWNLLFFFPPFMLILSLERVCRMVFSLFFMSFRSQVVCVVEFLLTLSWQSLQDRISPDASKSFGNSSAPYFRVRIYEFRVVFTTEGHECLWSDECISGCICMNVREKHSSFFWKHNFSQTVKTLIYKFLV